MRVLTIITSCCFLLGTASAVPNGSYPPIVKSDDAQTPLARRTSLRPAVNIRPEAYSPVVELHSQQLTPGNMQDVFCDDLKQPGIMGCLFLEGQGLVALFPRITFDDHLFYFVSSDQTVRSVIHYAKHGDIMLVRFNEHFNVRIDRLPSISNLQPALRGQYYMLTEDGTGEPMTLDHEIQVSMPPFISTSPLKTYVWQRAFGAHPFRSGLYSFSIAIDSDSAPGLFRSYSQGIREGCYSPTFCDRDSRGRPIVAPHQGSVVAMMTGRIHGSHQLTMREVLSYDAGESLLYVDPSGQWGLSSHLESARQVFQIHHFTQDKDVQANSKKMVQTLIAELLSGTRNKGVTQDFYTHAEQKTIVWLLEDLIRCIWINQFTDLSHYHEWIVHQTDQFLRNYTERMRVRE